MWKNIFIESLVLSCLIFGGFYINANFVREKITESEEKVRIHQDQSPTAHISGVKSMAKRPAMSHHISGVISSEAVPNEEKKGTEKPEIGLP